MQIFNSLSKKLEPFNSIEPDKIMMYVCGLTPYDNAHIGHTRTYVSFDVVKRFLIKRGYIIYHIQNITDVDDKIIKRCKETGADPKQLTNHNHDDALALFAQLHILPADVYPKVTEHIPDIIAIIQELIAAGSAYETETGVYFDISSYENYGKLSGQNLEQIKAGSRFGVDESKKNPGDFALWKKTTGEIIEFDSPWSTGRPGWHIECSAMARKYAKRTLDIHGGARDLIFPHHENEVAQSEAATKEKFCNYWMHTGFLTVNGEKMSKSLGNFITVGQALSKSSSNALRLFYLQAHYRSPLDYDIEKISAMEETVERIFNSMGLIREILGSGADSGADAEFRSKSSELLDSFYKNMEDDFNTPEALASMFSLLRLANSHLQKPDKEQLIKVLSSLEEIVWILGLVEQKPDASNKLPEVNSLLEELGSSAQKSVEESMKTLIQMRSDARAGKDFAKADLIRSKLADIGITLEDKPDGTKWKLS
ncbi:MAG: cysteine--tRNA ligase [Candidatus Micrarchaeota archaeon]